MPGDLGLERSAVIDSPGEVSADVSWPAQPDTAPSAARPAGKAVRGGEHRVRANNVPGRAWGPRLFRRRPEPGVRPRLARVRHPGAERLPPADGLDRLLHAEVIYVEGGNHYHLARSITGNGLADGFLKALEDRMYVGVSAGSMILAGISASAPSTSWGTSRTCTSSA